jgi:streptomycin 6-kinase
MAADGFPVVLKIQFPHRESEHEAEALRRWDGNGAVRLIASDPAHHALLLERCEPGNHLSTAGTDEALETFMLLLPRFWIGADQPFASLYDESAIWAKELPSLWEQVGRPFEADLLETALESIDLLRASYGEEVLVHQDLHGENVLRASREPWLVIDPKPLVGERELSIAPIVRACEFGHDRASVMHRLDRLTAALGLDRERARLWTLVQTLAWAFERGRVLSRHVETARWLRDG